MNYLRSFVNDEQGAELAEYAVGTAILVAIAIIVYKVLGYAAIGMRSNSFMTSGDTGIFTPHLAWNLG